MNNICEVFKECNVLCTIESIVVAQCRAHLWFKDSMCSLTAFLTITYYIHSKCFSKNLRFCEKLFAFFCNLFFSLRIYCTWQTHTTYNMNSRPTRVYCTARACATTPHLRDFHLSCCRLYDFVAVFQEMLGGRLALLECAKNKFTTFHVLEKEHLS